MSTPLPQEDPPRINSGAYWERRFRTDWEPRGGREQARFFARLALELMPAWLRAVVAAERFVVCDLGCALGDGTAELASAFGDDRVVGVDIAATAVEKARAAYPRVRFEVGEIGRLEELGEFDVLFSSNTLEHFADPWAVLQAAAAQARHLLVALVPFEERERIDEHEYTFLRDNLRPCLPCGMFLAHARVADVADRDGTYWPGRQLLLVYARPTAPVCRALDRFDAMDLSLGRETVAAEELAAIRATVDRLARAAADEQQRSAAMARELERRGQEWEDGLTRLTRLLEAVRADADRVRGRAEELRLELAAVRASGSWRVTGPLRWALSACRRVVAACTGAGRAQPPARA